MAALLFLYSSGSTCCLYACAGAKSRTSPEPSKSSKPPVALTYVAAHHRCTAEISSSGPGAGYWAPFGGSRATVPAASSTQMPAHPEIGFPDSRPHTGARARASIWAQTACLKLLHFRFTPPSGDDADAADSGYVLFVHRDDAIPCLRMSASGCKRAATPAFGDPETLSPCDVSHISGGGEHPPSRERLNVKMDAKGQKQRLSQGTIVPLSSTTNMFPHRLDKQYG